MKTMRKELGKGQGKARPNTYLFWWEKVGEKAYFGPKGPKEGSLAKFISM